LPSSTSASTAALVIALVCEAIRKIVVVVMRRPASLSAQPNRPLVNRLAIAQDEGDCARDAIFIDVALQQLVDSGGPPPGGGGEVPMRLSPALTSFAAAPTQQRLTQEMQTTQRS
jgi:hypothetical protein